MSINKRKPDVERGSYSIAEFCARNGLSIPTFRRLVSLGRGPAVSRYSAQLSRISVEAEAEWLKAFTTPPEEVQQEVKAHATQALAAAKKGVLAEGHKNKKTAGV
jgi:hypothetical protein